MKYKAIKKYINNIMKDKKIIKIMQKDIYKLFTKVILTCNYR